MNTLKLEFDRPKKVPMLVYDKEDSNKLQNGKIKKKVEIRLPCRTFVPSLWVSAVAAYTAGRPKAVLTVGQPAASTPSPFLLAREVINLVPTGCGSRLLLFTIAMAPAGNICVFFYQSCSDGDPDQTNSHSDSRFE